MAHTLITEYTQLSASQELFQPTYQWPKHLFLTSMHPPRQMSIKVPGTHKVI